MGGDGQRCNGRKEKEVARAFGRLNEFWECWKVVHDAIVAIHHARDQFLIPAMYDSWSQFCWSLHMAWCVSSAIWMLYLVYHRNSFSICSSIVSYACLSVNCLSVRLSVCLSVCLSICMSACLSASLCLFVPFLVQAMCWSKPRMNPVHH